MTGPIVAVSTVADGTMHNRLALEDPEIIANRQTWLAKQGIALDDTTRVQVSYEDGENFCRYREATELDKGVGMRGLAPIVDDALVTTQPGHALFLPIADCIAATFYDPENQVLMLSHLGRHSLEQRGGYKSAMYLCEQYGSKPENLQIWLSPAAGKNTYPIFKLNNMGLKEALYAQLANAGVSHNHINDMPVDTVTSLEYYSHSAYLRGDKPTDGRFAMVAMIPL